MKKGMRKTQIKLIERANRWGYSEDMLRHMKREDFTTKIIWGIAVLAIGAAMGLYAITHPGGFIAKAFEAAFRVPLLF